MRAVIYARYSTDLQREASIEDQVRLCRSRIDTARWSLTDTYTDAAISGASRFRPGYQRLLEDARRGAFDVVVAEALDRLSRDQEDIAGLYKTLCFHGMKLVTLAEGEINELHVGLKGTMNALFIKDLAAKTRRGLEGRVRKGRSGGGICYGYDMVPGDPGARKINEAQAHVIRRIFRDYAAGKSPRAIVRDLNRQGVPGPHGRPWRDTTVRGHITRGTGILNNELYAGRLVWNRLTYVKDPNTGRRRSRLNPKEEWITERVPDLKVVDDSLWETVKQRQAAIRHSEGVTRARATRFWEHRRPHGLLTGLVVCGVCGSRFSSVGRDYLACSSARGRGTCPNGTSIRRSRLEDLICDALRDRLMAPELVEEFVAAVHEELNLQLRNEQAAHGAKEQELAAVKRKIASLVEAIADGLRGSDLQQRLDELSSRRDTLVRELAEPKAPPIRLHPSLAKVYRDKVGKLAQSLRDPSIHDEAIQVLHGLVERIAIFPNDAGLEVEITGEIAKMVELGMSDATNEKAVLNAGTACSVKVVAGARFVQERTGLSIERAVWVGRAGSQPPIA